jgi:hypothetical protein
MTILSQNPSREETAFEDAAFEDAALEDAALGNFAAQKKLENRFKKCQIGAK